MSTSSGLAQCPSLQSTFGLTVSDKKSKNWMGVNKPIPQPLFGPTGSQAIRGTDRAFGRRRSQRAPRRVGAPGPAFAPSPASASQAARLSALCSLGDNVTRKWPRGHQHNKGGPQGSLLNAGSGPGGKVEPRGRGSGRYPGPLCPIPTRSAFI